MGEKANVLLVSVNRGINKMAANGLNTLAFMLLNYLRIFFIHLKLELLTQFPASNKLKLILFFFK